ncbi:MAG: fumarate/nitrate reduction transcriptional regulator Fnr [Thioalkalispiraceae bacterium]|jgi:CRP/FNR family transcriptional regulator
MASKVVNLASVQSACQQCGIYGLCLPMGLKRGDLDLLDSIIKRRRPLKKGEHLYSAGEEFTSVYAIRSGSIKSYTINEEGEEHVIGFKMPGDLVGLNGINGHHYKNSAKALETCSVCEIPFAQLEELGHEIPGLTHHLMEIMSKEIQDEHYKVAMCSKMPAEARLASLLHTLSLRFEERGYSPNEFNLSMSRNDIANMLGLAVETVSRLFTHFQEDGILEVERKHIRILDHIKLCKAIKLA